VSSQVALQAQAILELERRKGTWLPLSERYAKFQAEYYDRPDRFDAECIRWRSGQAPTDYQATIMQNLMEYHREAVRGPHGPGKTAIAAKLVLWFALTRDGRDWKIPTTASAWRQLTKYLWPEVHKWARMLDWRRIGRAPFTRYELLTMQLKLSTGEAFALASNQPDALEGAHADHIFYILDEAKSIPDGTWDAIEGALLGEGEVFAFAISTPGISAGRFYQINMRGEGVRNWHVTHITADQAIRAGRVQQERANFLKALWGEKSPIYIRRVLGDFADDSPDGLIPLSWVEASNERWKDAEDELPSISEATAMGVDVGGGALGGDQSVIAIAKGRHLIELRKIAQSYEPEQATMELVGKVRGLLDASGMPHEDCFIDVIGIGAGVVARLREMGYAVSAFNSSSKSKKKDASGELGYANWRAAGWAILRDALSPTEENPLLLPEDDELLGDLTAPKISLRSDARYLVEAKDKIRERLKRSTDCGDAVMMMVAGPELRKETEKKHRPVRSWIG